jgi:hypothetical protein
MEPMPEDQTSDFADRFNREGGPVPEANPEHLRRMWKHARENASLGKGKTSGFGALGLDASDLGDAPRDKITILTLRLGLVQSLCERNVLRDYLHGDELAEEVFQAAASLPCDKEDVAEAMVLLTMKQQPQLDYSELRREMTAHGYNPDEPKIDSKFLEWIRNR